MTIQRSDYSREKDQDPEGWLVRTRKALAWSVLERAMKRRQPDARAIRAAEITLDRYQPAPRAVVQATITGPVVLTWTEPSSSPTPLARSRPSSTSPGSGNGQEPVSSSATDSLESL